jgi:TRAP-type C4-dicarboxylate transport system substrate-binding protein
MQTTHRIRVLPALLTCLSVTLSAACSSPVPTAAPLVLRIGTDDDAETPAADQIRHFADEVSTRSHGTLKIEPVWHAAGEDIPHWDQAVAKLVIEGKLDLGMVPSRAWDDLGVTSLRALNTPFLITTDTLTAGVVTDAGLTLRLTSGLPSAGVSALGLYPEGLRHPFGFDRPLRGAADYHGGLIRMAWSRTGNALFEAFGARTGDGEPDHTTMIGAESSYRLSPAGIATGNVTFYPKINVLTARSHLEEKLTGDQRTQLRAAADATGRWVIANQPSDQKAAQTFCAEGGKIAAASPAQLDSLVAGARGVVQNLREDPATAALIDAITTMKKNDPETAPITSCAMPGARASR